MTHTPGPWAPERLTFDQFYLAVRAGQAGPRICEVRPENQEANAHLIAAAPEMLEALERLVEAADPDSSALPLAIAAILERLVEAADPQMVERDLALEFARTVIRKAKREA